MSHLSDPRSVIFALCGALALGCGGRSGPSLASVDLPAGWEDAKRVTQLTQDDCSGSPYEGADERISVTPGTGKLAIDYQEAHFRCEQDVEGFYRSTGSALDVLVQPIDMDPDSVAACDCLYDVTIGIDPVAPGSRQVTVYRRWDNINDPNDPVRIGSEDVEVAQLADVVLDDDLVRLGQHVKRLVGEQSPFALVKAIALAEAILPRCTVRAPAVESRENG